MKSPRILSLFLSVLLIGGCGDDPVSVRTPEIVSLLVEGENPYVGDSVLALFNRGLEYKLAQSTATGNLFDAYVDSSVTYALQAYALGPASTGSGQSARVSMPSSTLGSLIGGGLIAAPLLEDRGITSLRDYFDKGADSGGGYAGGGPPSCSDLRLAVLASNRAISRVSPQARARLGEAGWSTFVGALSEATWAGQTNQRMNGRATVYSILFGLTVDNGNFAMDAGKTVIQNSFLKAFYAQCPTQ